MSELAIKGGTPVVPEDEIKPWPIITDEEKQAVTRAMEESTPWRNPLPEVVRLEEDWARYTGSEYCLAVNSGTAALHMAVAAAGVGPGDEVIVPAFTFLASASCVLHSNGIPIFADIDPQTCNLDPESVEEHITDRTKAIIAVDIQGLPADYEPLRRIADEQDLVLIEDGSQAQGATYRGHKVGSLGDMAGISLNGSKNLSSLCEGGLFTTDNEEMKEMAERVRMFGEEIKPGQPRQYNAYTMGWNYRSSSMEAAFTRCQIRKLDEYNAARIRNCEYLTEHLSEMPGIYVPEVPKDRTNVYFFWVMRVRPQEYGLDVPVGAFRDALSKAMQAEGVPLKRWQRRTVLEQTLFHYKDGYGKGCPWDCKNTREGIEYNPEDYPEAVRLIDEFLCIGHSEGGITPPNDTDLMQLYVDAFHKVMVENKDEFLELIRQERED